MIVACPECSRPFEIADDQIAALVQIECPSCAFRMILDFEAANDPSLVEAGMKMASGWRSAADYHAAFAAPEPEAPRPHLVTAPEPEPELEPEPRPVLEPEPIVLSRPGRVGATTPSRPAAPAMPPASYEARPPAFEAEETRIHHEPPSDDAKTVMEAAPQQPAVSEDAPTVAPPSASPPPSIEVRLDASMEEDEGPTQIHTPSLKTITQAPRTSDVVVRKQVVVAAAAEELPARTGGTTVGPAPTEARVPPHTPPGRPVVEEAAPAVPQRDTPRPRPAPRFESMDLPDEDEKPARSSALGTFVVVLLLLSALGLVGASVALEQTWDPRPLLEKVYRQTFK